MRITATLRVLSFLILAIVPALCWSDQPEVRRDIHFPNLPGYQTLACDLHQHTVFSDGKVWPTVRVGEAWRQGLDALAISDHIEYRPHKGDIPAKHGRSHELAEDAAKAHGLLLIRAAEITRDTPPGHFNALFLSDIRLLDKPNFLDAIKEANRQGAFVFWNHQGWQGEEKGRWLDVHQTMYDNKWFQGMEVANGDEYYPTAHKWCLEKNLTLMGNTDIHDPDLRQESSSKDHRTMTLVFVKERTPAGVKEALEARRTIVWFKDQLIGREELLRPFFEACVQVGRPTIVSKTNMIVPVRNQCETDICLQAKGKARPVTLPAMSTILLTIPLDAGGKPIAQKYTVKNFLIAPGKGLRVTLNIPPP